jgi:hypothetical protein
MRPRACIPLLLLAFGGGCAQIPDHVRVEIDGGSIEFKKAPPPLATGDPTPPADPDANGIDGDGR